MALGKVCMRTILSANCLFQWISDIKAKDCKTVGLFLPSGCGPRKLLTVPLSLSALLRFHLIGFKLLV